MRSSFAMLLFLITANIHAFDVSVCAELYKNDLKQKDSFARMIEQLTPEQKKRLNKRIVEELETGEALEKMPKAGTDEYNGLMCLASIFMIGEIMKFDQVREEPSPADPGEFITLQTNAVIFNAPHCSDSDPYICRNSWGIYDDRATHTLVEYPTNTINRYDKEHYTHSMRVQPINQGTRFIVMDVVHHDDRKYLLLTRKGYKKEIIEVSALSFEWLFRKDHYPSDDKLAQAKNFFPRTILWCPSQDLDQQTMKALPDLEHPRLAIDSFIKAFGFDHENSEITLSTTKECWEGRHVGFQNNVAYHTFMMFHRDWGAAGYVYDVKE